MNLAMVNIINVKGVWASMDRRLQILGRAIGKRISLLARSRDGERRTASRCTIRNADQERQPPSRLEEAERNSVDALSRVRFADARKARCDLDDA